MDDVYKKISINPQRGISLAHQVNGQLSWLIVSGLIKPGERLPSVRNLAQQLNINLHTVRNAYAMLESDGLVETRQGWGTKVLEPDPLRLAESIARSRSHTIGVIIPSLFQPSYHEMLQGIQERADHDQTMIFVCNTQDQETQAWRYLNQLLAKQVDGIIVVSEGFEQFLPPDSDLTLTESLGVPFVSVDIPESRGYSIVMDLEDVGYRATSHLIKHGHKRIGLITFGIESAETRLEDQGYRRAIQEAGVDFDPTLVVPVPGYNVAEGKQGMGRLMELPDPPSAIFAICDSLAIGAMQAVSAAGLIIPDDIALVGFNDIPLAAMLNPPLTTISMPSYEMGIEAMKMLSTLIDGEKPEHRTITFPTPFVVRQSCGCDHE